MKAFDRFWALYPRRNGKKVGKYPCELWFEAKKPNEAEVEQIMEWLKIDNHNRKSSKEFYAHLPDPIRFLRMRMWRDDIEKIKTKGFVSDICKTEGCLNKWVSNYLCRPCLNKQ